MNCASETRSLNQIFQSSSEVASGLVWIEASVDGHLIALPLQIDCARKIRTTVHEEKVIARRIADEHIPQFVRQLSDPKWLLQDGKSVENHHWCPSENWTCRVGLAAHHVKPANERSCTKAIASASSVTCGEVPRACSIRKLARSRPEPEHSLS